MILDLSTRLFVVWSSLISSSNTLPLAHSDAYTWLSCHSSNRTSSYPKTFPLILPSAWNNLPPDISVAPAHLCQVSTQKYLLGPWVPCLKYRQVPPPQPHSLPLRDLSTKHTLPCDSYSCFLVYYLSIPSPHLNKEAPWDRRLGFIHTAASKLSIMIGAKTQCWIKFQFKPSYRPGGPNSPLKPHCKVDALGRCRRVPAPSLLLKGHTYGPWILLKDMIKYQK